MKTILGLDISSRNCGFALIRDGIMLDDGTLKRKKDEEIPDFCQRASEALLEIVKECGGRLRCIAYETQVGPIPAYMRKAIMDAQQVVGGIRAVLGCSDIQMGIQATAKGRKKGDKKGAVKKRRRAAMEAIYSKCANQHSADALAVAHAAIGRLAP
jgi:Holliday junction resolvasome RuvABC endonuclease subunit